jgi:hypothetical protein
MRVKNGWIFSAAAGIPCAVLLLLCGVALREWWLISSGQIAVIPAPMPGQHSAVEVPAASLLPLILGSGILAASFAYALLRGSRSVLMCAYLAVFLLIAMPFVRRLL